MHVHFANFGLKPLLHWLDLAGIAVFAVSGALAAARIRLDLIGMGFFALVTAVGGGTVRDLLIGAPILWIREPAPLLTSLLIAGVVWIGPARWWRGDTLEWFDAAGLASYASYGAEKALHFGVSPLPAIAMGVVTACVGGVLRDMLAGVPSILLRHELYIAAALLSASLVIVLTACGLADSVSVLISAPAGFALRAAAIKWRLAMPGYRVRGDGITR